MLSILPLIIPIVPHCLYLLLVILAAVAVVVAAVVGGGGRGGGQPADPLHIPKVRALPRRFHGIPHGLIDRRRHGATSAAFGQESVSLSMVLLTIQLFIAT